jgi:L-asparaginase/Glu-tRNA(Gln) amidotransferase subunit D
MKEIGVLVTHGTDTLAWTLPFIRYALKDFPLNVCLTGSQVPMDKAFAGSDGFQNVHGGVRFLSNLEPPSVFAVFNNGQDAYSDSLAKVERWRPDAFTGDPIAHMEWDEIQHRAGDARLREPVVLDILHVITTGGTIDSRLVADEEGGLAPGQSVVEEFLNMAMPDSFQELKVHAACALDSSEIDRKAMEVIASEIYTCGEGVGELDLDFAEGVHLLTCDPFMHKDDYCEIVDRSPAVVLAGYGGGHANPDLRMNNNVMEALHLANEQNKIFVLSSQVPVGPADFIYKTARSFIRQGALSGVDLSLPECQLRLMYILGHSDEIEFRADQLGLSSMQVMRRLFMSGMKFRNRTSRDNFTHLTGGQIILDKQDWLVGDVFHRQLAKLK